jgi:uncharacterized cupin superfamily protein
VVPEARLERTDTGLVPRGEGWFVVNAREARWWESDFGVYTRFEGEGEAKFDRIGVNLSLLWPTQPSCMYHREDEQEDFLVLSGECLLLIEGEERPLKAWDFVHCPPWTDHVFVGAGDGPSLILALGGRTGGDVVYPASELAQRYGAGAEEETADANEAYAAYRDAEPVQFRDEWLPEGPGAPPR